jgi:hypothetical protein
LSLQIKEKFQGEGQRAGIQSRARRGTDHFGKSDQSASQINQIPSTS